MMMRWCSHNIAQFHENLARWHYKCLTNGIVKTRRIQRYNGWLAPRLWEMFEQNSGTSTVHSMPHGLLRAFSFLWRNTRLTID